MMNPAVVSIVTILGAGTVYNKETVQQHIGYIQKCISKVAVSMERNRWRENVKGKKDRIWC